MRPGYSYKPKEGEELPYAVRRTLGQILWLVAHHTGKGVGNPTLLDTVAWQISPQAQAPFPGLAYTGFVDRDGTICLAWDLETVTWSQGDNSPMTIKGIGSYNFQGVAFCFSGQDPTPEQLAAYKKIKRALEAILGRSVQVRSHRDVCGPSDTECAGDVLQAALPDLNA